MLLIYPLEWPMAAGAAAATLDHYAARTDPDGPAMTDSVHAIDAATIGEPGCATYTYLRRAARPFVRGPYNLFSEARGEKSGAQDPLSGFPAEDFLTGKGGFLQVFTHGLTGLRLREDGVRLDPLLPPQLREGVELTGLRYRGRTYDIAVGPRTTTVRLTDGAPFTVHTPAGPRRLPGTRRPHPPPRPRPDVRRGPLPPGDGHLRGPRPVRRGGGGRQRHHGLGTRRRNGTLTVDLGRPTRVGQITPHWNATRPKSYNVQVSRDGKHWSGTGYAGAAPRPGTYGSWCTVTRPRRRAASPSRTRGSRS